MDRLAFGGASTEGLISYGVEPVSMGSEPVAMEKS